MWGSTASVDPPPSLRTVLSLFLGVRQQVSIEPCDTLSDEHGETESGEEGSYGSKQNAEDWEVGNERDQDEAQQDHGSVLVHEVYKAIKGARQEREDHLRAVERRDRDQVEYEEQRVGEGDHDHEYEQVAALFSEGWKQVKGGADGHDEKVRDESC